LGVLGPDRRFRASGENLAQVGVVVAARLEVFRIDQGLAIRVAEVVRARHAGRLPHGWLPSSERTRE
jgi:hypothetical protein